jgi:hypothetical protein
VNQCVYGVKRSSPTIYRPFVSKHPRVQAEVIKVGVAAYARYGFMSGTFDECKLHQPYHRVGIVARHH